MCFASPKIIQKSALFRSQNFVTKYLSVGEVQNAANTDVLASILTKPQRKILAPKSGSSFTALARRRKMGVSCGNYLCVYEQDGECWLDEISITEEGTCECCIYPSFDDETLQKAKDNTFRKLEGFQR